METEEAPFMGGLNQELRTSSSSFVLQNLKRVTVEGLFIRSGNPRPIEKGDIAFPMTIATLAKRLPRSFENLYPIAQYTKLSNNNEGYIPYRTYKEGIWLDSNIARIASSYDEVMQYMHQINFDTSFIVYTPTLSHTGSEWLTHVEGVTTPHIDIHGCISPIEGGLIVNVNVLTHLSCVVGTAPPSIDDETLRLSSNFLCRCMTVVRKYTCDYTNVEDLFVARLLNVISEALSVMTDGSLKMLAKGGQMIYDIHDDETVSELRKSIIKSYRLFKCQELTDQDILAHVDTLLLNTITTMTFANRGSVFNVDLQVLFLNLRMKYDTISGYVFKQFKEVHFSTAVRVYTPAPIIHKLLRRDKEGYCVSSCLNTFFQLYILSLMFGSGNLRKVGSVDHPPIKDYKHFISAYRMCHPLLASGSLSSLIRAAVDYYSCIYVPTPLPKDLPTTPSDIIETMSVIQYAFTHGKTLFSEYVESIETNIQLLVRSMQVPNRKIRSKKALTIMLLILLPSKYDEDTFESFTSHINADYDENSYRFFNLGVDEKSFPRASLLEMIMMILVSEIQNVTSILEDITSKDVMVHKPCDTRIFYHWFFSNLFDKVVWDKRFSLQERRIIPLYCAVLHEKIGTFVKLFKLLPRYTIQGLQCIQVTASAGDGRMKDLLATPSSARTLNAEPFIPCSLMGRCLRLIESWAAIDIRKASIKISVDSSKSYSDNAVLNSINMPADFSKELSLSESNCVINLHSVEAVYESRQISWPALIALYDVQLTHTVDVGYIMAKYVKYDITGIEMLLNTYTASNRVLNPGDFKLLELKVNHVKSLNIKDYDINAAMMIFCKLDCYIHTSRCTLEAIKTAFKHFQTAIEHEVVSIDELSRSTSLTSVPPDYHMIHSKGRVVLDPTPEYHIDEETIPVEERSLSYVAISRDQFIYDQDQNDDDLMVLKECCSLYDLKYLSIARLELLTNGFSYFLVFRNDAFSSRSYVQSRLESIADQTMMLHRHAEYMIRTHNDAMDELNLSISRLEKSLEYERGKPLILQNGFDNLNIERIKLLEREIEIATKKITLKTSTLESVKKEYSMIMQSLRGSPMTKTFLVTSLERLIEDKVSSISTSGEAECIYCEDKDDLCPFNNYFVCLSCIYEKRIVQMINVIKRGSTFFMEPLIHYRSNCHTVFSGNFSHLMFTRHVSGWRKSPTLTERFIHPNLSKSLVKSRLKRQLMRDEDIAKWERKFEACWTKRAWIDKKTMNESITCSLFFCGNVLTEVVYSGFLSFLKSASIMSHQTKSNKGAICFFCDKIHTIEDCSAEGGRTCSSCLALGKDSGFYAISEDVSVTCPKCQKLYEFASGCDELVCCNGQSQFIGAIIDAYNSANPKKQISERLYTPNGFHGCFNKGLKEAITNVVTSKQFIKITPFSEISNEEDHERLNEVIISLLEEYNLFHDDDVRCPGCHSKSPYTRGCCGHTWRF